MDGVTHHGRRTAYRRSDRTDDVTGEGGGGGGSRGTRDEGQSPGAVLCIHGSGGSAGVWKSQSRLADRRPVVTLDLSGHGESDDVDADPGYGCRGSFTEGPLGT